MTAEIEQAVAKLVAAAPKLTNAQRDRIATLLHVEKATEQK